MLINLLETKLKSVYPIVALCDNKKTPSFKWSVKENHIDSDAEYINVLRTGKYDFTTSKGNIWTKDVTGFAILTGEQSGIYVLDLDRKNGEDGVAALKEICEEVGADFNAVTNTFTVKTPNDGLHLFYKYVPNGLTHDAGIIPGVDVRTDGGIIITPGTQVKKKETVKKKQLTFMSEEDKEKIISYSLLKDVDLIELDERVLDRLKDAQMLKKSVRHSKDGKPMQTTRRERAIQDANTESIMAQVKLANIDDLYLSDIGFRALGRSNSTEGHGVCPLHPGADNPHGFTYNTTTYGWRQYYCHTRHCVEAESIIDICRVHEGFENSNLGIMEATLFLAKKYNIKLKFKDISESINFSDYDADDYYEIEKYLNEEVEGINRILYYAQDGKNCLLLADTGSGKTYTMINSIKDIKGLKVLFVLPNASNVAQVSKKYDLHGVWGDETSAMDFVGKEDIVVMTWNKFAKIPKESLSDYIVMFDEVHQTYTEMYRKDVIIEVMNLIPYCRARIDITATPNKLNFEDYEYIAEYRIKEDFKTKVNVCIYNKSDLNTVIEIANKSKKCIIQKNHTGDLQFIKSQINKISSIITSHNRDENELMAQIIDKENMGNYEALLCTTVLNAGVNIEDEDITDIVIMGIKDITAPVQLVARARKVKKINLHIMGSFKEECKTYSIERLLNRKLEVLEKICDAKNTIIAEEREYYQEYGVDMGKTSFAKVDGEILFDADENKYVVNDVLVRATCYRDYTNSRTIYKYKELLEEYFNNIKIVEISETVQSARVKEDAKAEKRKFKDVKQNTVQDFEEYKNLMVAYAPMFQKNAKVVMGDVYYYISTSLDMTSDEYKAAIKEMELNGIIKEFRLEKMLENFSQLFFNYKYSLDVAWTLANLSVQKREDAIASISNISKFKLMNTNSKYFNENRIENQYAFYILNTFKPGLWYADNHLECAVETLKKKLANTSGMSVNTLKKRLKTFFKITDIRIRQGQEDQMTDENGKLFEFLGGIVPEFGEKDRVRIYRVDRVLTIEDIKNLLSVKRGDTCIEDKVLSLIEKEHNRNGIKERAEQELIEQLIDNKNILEQIAI